MVESYMYFAMGFFLAALGLVVVAPLVHGRAVRLTVGRLESAIPACAAEVVADKDLLRAEFAMSARRLEVEIDKLRTRSAHDRAELGRKNDAVNRLKSELAALRAPATPAEADSTRESIEPDISADYGSIPTTIAVADGASPAPPRGQEEMAALRVEIEVLRKCLGEAGAEIRALNAEQTELESTRQALADEQLKFENFHRRVAELVLQLIRQAARDGLQGARIRDVAANDAKQSALANYHMIAEKPAA